MNKSISNFIRTSVIGFASLVWISCAQIVAPTGGAKDTTPPKVEKEIPSNINTSFNATEITIKFDEYIQLKNTEDQVVISPPMETKPQFEVLGKNLVITLRSTLKPQTTYTINFGNSIVDNHEGNILSGYTYVFSTGASIDSLNIRGNIHNSFDLKPDKALSVCLYSTDSFTDSTIYLNKPLYFTKTDDQGLFFLKNLPDQTFQLVAFKDENKNLKYDKNEHIAFYSQPVNSRDTIPLKPFFSFQPNAYPINKLIDTFCNQTGKYTFVVYKPSNISIKPVKAVDFYTLSKPGKDQIDTITLISSDWKQGDSVSFIFQSDSTHHLSIKPRKATKATKFLIQMPKETELNDTIRIKLNQPYSVVKTDTNGIILMEDTLIVSFKVFETENRDVLKLYHPLKNKTKYSLQVKDSAFIDFYGAYNKGDKTQFTTKGIKDYSNLTLTILPKKDSYSYILQIIDEADTRVYHQYTIVKKQEIPLTYVIPGKYRIKVIRDNNRNGKWDNGDYHQGKQPEQVFYYSETLNLRAYWDLEQLIDLNLFVD